MLQFNPHFRLTAEECLRSPYFEKFKISADLKTAKHQVKMPIENMQSTEQVIREEFKKEIYEWNEQFSSSHSSVSNVKQESFIHTNS